MEKPSVLKSEDSPRSGSLLETDTAIHTTDHHHGKHHSKAEEVARIDALATAPGVSMSSFAHLDEKKILRKMDLRLIPMLALLYLLSFL